MVPQPIQEVPAVHYENTSELTKKISAMELSQQNVRSEVDTVSQQVGTVNNNIDNLNNQIASLNQVISTLSTQMSKQTEEIGMLMARTQPKHIIKTQVKSTIPQFLYTIQAVIPGRAWLIGSNGSTLTVREGTKISGYGIVKLIDSMQGRVLTSSGKVIRFSQEDS
jgi:intracellular multiplication protein IcmG